MTVGAEEHPVEIHRGYKDNLVEDFDSIRVDFSNDSNNWI